MGPLVARLLAAVAVLLVLASPARADEGWTIESYASDIAIQPDGSFSVIERINVDFDSLSKHGIFRYVPYRYSYDDQRDRVTQLSVLAVTDTHGQSIRYEESRDHGNVVLKIGDPNRTISGRQGYVIRYAVRGALNPFDDHDELYWNVTGTGWPVAARAVTATVSLPGVGLQRVTCFEGPLGSTEPCRASNTAQTATFQAARTLGSGEDLTIVLELAKGLVPVAPLSLQSKERSVNDLPTLFAASPVMLGAAALVLVAGLALVVTNWYSHGRDHAYLTNYYLTNDPREGVRPMFAGQTIAPEYEPPEKLHPAEAGLLLDERADPKDVTATIVDLAARGYLTITEIPKQLFGSRDWSLGKIKSAGAELAQYERLIFDGLFRDGDTVKLSELKGHFYRTLHSAQEALYDDSVNQNWFIGSPEGARTRWAALGCLVVGLGVALTVGLGLVLGGGLVGLAVVLVGSVLIPLSRAMAARSAKGSELLRRFLGFRMYMLTAEKDRTKFAEKEGIFSAYLPYAIVFGIVERWVNAFRGLDAAAASAAAWYIGSGAFNASAFSGDLQSFSHSLSLSVASTPGGSGSSGFGGGGFSGGGGGGGGGGSW